MSSKITVGELVAELPENVSKQQVEQVKSRAKEIIDEFALRARCIGCRYEGNCINIPGSMDCVDMAERATG